MRHIVPALCMLIILLLPGAASRAGAPCDGDAITPAELEGHIRFLSDDLLEGRGVGSKGIELAALYHESQFRSIGLKPLFGKSYRQRFTLAGATPDEAATLEFYGAAAQLEARRCEEFVVNSSRDDCPRVTEGELVYCGYLIEAPERDWNDVKGADLRGKVLLVEVNEPENRPGGIFDGEDMTYYGRWTYKLEKAAALGALGVLLIHESRGAGYGWDVVRNSWTGEELRLEEKKSPLSFHGWIHRECAERVFTLAGRSRGALRAGAETKGFAPTPLGVKVRVCQRPAFRTVAAENVGALLEGDRSGSGSRFIVLSAHYDHLGRDAAAQGDRIYNGAVDNCSASACLLALARWYARRPESLPASLVFLAPSAEEHGLLGSEYFTKNLPIPRAAIMADLNFEMTGVWGETRDVYAIGARHSELDDFCSVAARNLGLDYIPERGGEAGFFFRSDQLSFARVGIPSVWLHEGGTSAGGDKGLAARKQEEYRRKKYHTPADEMGDDWDLTGAAQLARWAQEIVSLLSRAERLPRFRATSSFGRDDH